MLYLLKTLEAFQITRSELLTANTTLQNYSDDKEKLSSELAKSKQQFDELLRAAEQKNLSLSKLNGKLHEQECIILSTKEQLKEARLRLQDSDARVQKSQELVEELQVRCTETLSRYASSQADVTALCSRLEDTKTLQSRLVQL